MDEMHFTSRFWPETAVGKMTVEALLNAVAETMTNVLRLAEKDAPKWASIRLSKLMLIHGSTDESVSVRATYECAPLDGDATQDQIEAASKLLRANGYHVS